MKVVNKLGRKVSGGGDIYCRDLLVVNVHSIKSCECALHKEL